MSEIKVRTTGAITGVEKVRKYAKNHQKYARLMYADLIKTIRSRKISGRCLDAGAGPGHAARMVVKENPGIIVTAIDLSPDMAAVACDYIHESGLDDRIQYMVGDVGDAGLLRGLGKFDLVYSTFSLHHWQEADKSLRNLWNAIADGGVLYLYDFRRIGWLYSLPLKMHEMNSIKSSYIPQEIASILKREGLTPYSITTPFPFLFLSIIVCK